MSLHRPSKNARLMTAHSSAAILRLSLLSAQTSDLQSGIPTAAQRPWQAAPSACTITKRYQSSRLLRSRHHRCCPLYCAPGRLDGFSSLRSLRSVPLTHCGCAPASLTLIRCSASAHSGSTTLAQPRNHQDSRSGHREEAVFAPLTESDGDLQGCPGRAGVYVRYQNGSQQPRPPHPY